MVTVPSPRLLEDFTEFHRDNPHVLVELEALVRDRFDHGQSKTGMKAAFEVLRWQKELVTSGTPYKLNNNFTSFYARLLIRRNPHWRGRIETRGDWDIPSTI